MTDSSSGVPSEPGPQSSVPDPRSWPLREPSAGRIAWCAVVGGALVGAATIVPNRPGIGWLLSGTAVAAGLVAVRTAVTGGTGADRGRSGWAAWVQVGWGALALALLGVGTLRAATWLFVLCLLAAGLAAALAVNPGRTALGVFFAVATVPVAAGRGVRWLLRGVTERRLGPGFQARTAAAVGVTLLLIVAFGGLFAMADPAFARLIGGMVPTPDVAGLPRWLFFGGAVATITTAGAFLMVNPTRFGDLSLPPPRPLRPVEWALPVGGLVAVFALFLCVQAAVLFRDEAYVKRVAGLTFADYARQGFWQLLLVTMLTLMVIAVVARKAPRDGSGQRLLLRCLLGALSALALLVVASALWRMTVYEQAYGFTRLRLTVYTFEVWLGALFVMVIIAGVRLRAAWLPPAVVASGLVALLGLAAVNPDGFIAERNIDRFHRTGLIDVAYLRQLSPDAAPALTRLPGVDRRCALRDIADDLSEPDPWNGYNVGRAAARRVDLPDPADPVDDCY